MHVVTSIEAKVSYLHVRKQLHDNFANMVLPSGLSKQLQRSSKWRRRIASRNARKLNEFNPYTTDLQDKMIGVCPHSEDRAVEEVEEHGANYHRIRSHNLVRIYTKTRQNKRRHCFEVI